MTTKRMWNGGPLRQFSPEPFTGSIPVENGHAGAYVCEACGSLTKGRRYSGATEGVKLANSEEKCQLSWVCAYCELTTVQVAMLSKHPESRVSA